jgi:hypothetical protein
MKLNRLALIVVCTLVMTVVGTTSPAEAAPRWAPASKATIHPGVRTNTSGLQCRASFVFYDARAVYLAQAAHCAGFPGQSVKIEGASRRGTVVYNSRFTMDRVFEPNEATRRGNDFALVRIHSEDRDKVNPSTPFWGGPTASGARSSLGARVYSYGNTEVYVGGVVLPNRTRVGDEVSGSRGVNTLSPRVGFDTTAFVAPFIWCLRCDGTNEGWTRYIYTAAPGHSGAGGSAVLDERGRALGIVGGAAHDAADRVTDLSKAIAYMKAKTNLDAIQLAKGTEPFLPREATKSLQENR